MKQITELQKLFSLILHINECYAAQADVEPNWKTGELVVTVDEGGKTLYSAVIEMNEGQDAKARLIRHELEQMIADCKFPIEEQAA